ncbi:hypothetical protein QBC38DRAFT_531143 [Podospora fimiseda]|uniref:Uncharacterized protein n=1 Tax=Podospora fimiseda TaxID=252190 RepID=A0AAN7BKI9_9PEZI|nr:hypothetical protein QBC38DRAFT_531143 [Podospora fimiseda]
MFRIVTMLILLETWRLFSPKVRWSTRAYEAPHVSHQGPSSCRIWFDVKRDQVNSRLLRAQPNQNLETIPIYKSAFDTVIRPHPLTTAIANSPDNIDTRERPPGDRLGPILTNKVEIRDIPQPTQHVMNLAPHAQPGPVQNIWTEIGIELDDTTQPTNMILIPRNGDENMNPWKGEQWKVANTANKQLFARDLTTPTTQTVISTSTATITDSSTTRTMEVIASEITDAAGSFYTHFTSVDLPAATSVVAGAINNTADDGKNWLDGETNGLSNKVLLAIVVVVPVVVIFLVVWLAL